MAMLPAYVRVYNTIKHEIVDGLYSIGDFLPPEAELCKRFGVSRVTIRHATELLARDGYIVIKQGYGTTVCDRHAITQGLNTVTSLTETLQAQGYCVETRDTIVGYMQPNDRLTSELNLSAGSKVIRIQRIRLADQTPIAIMKNYLIPEMVPGIEKRLDKCISLYHLLEDYYNITIDSAWDRISAKVANEEEARMLGVPSQTALINFRRICYMNKQPVCVDQAYILGDFYQYEFFISGRNRNAIE